MGLDFGLSGFEASNGSRFVALLHGNLTVTRAGFMRLHAVCCRSPSPIDSYPYQRPSEVAHAVRNSHAITERRRLSIWRITAWASALYGLHVVGLTEQGLAALESHMIYQLRFVLRSYSQSTRETNEHLLRRRGFKTAKAQIVQRLKQFLKRQKKGDKEALLPFFLPRAERLAELLPQLWVAERGSTGSLEHQHVCTECGAIFVGTGALRRHSQKHHPGARLSPKVPNSIPKSTLRLGLQNV